MAKAKSETYMLQFIPMQRPQGPDQRAQLREAWQVLNRRPEIGFLQLSENQELWQAIEARAQNARPSQRVLVVGIGGSSLGAQAIKQCLGYGAKSQVFFLESPDPHSWAQLGDLQSPEWRDKHILIISKSGNTLETLSWVEKLAACDPQWLKNSQVTVIASPGEGILQTWAKREGLPCLWIPTNVGGRFSVLTAVGMLPARLMGLNSEGFREGARWALKNSELAVNISQDILYSWSDQRWITQAWTFCEGLRLFGEWWQQLWGESLGKKLDRKGKPAARASTPMPCLGPRDQHSLVQQLIEGTQDKYVFITRVKAVESDGKKFTPSSFSAMPFHNKSISLGEVLGIEAQAFTRSLEECAIPHSVLQVEQLNEQSLGALFMLWQMVIGILGESMDIDAFNQPGVEIGKKYAAQILRQ
jgi:glucose-6-phosphate isomerase